MVFEVDEEDFKMFAIYCPGSSVNDPLSKESAEHGETEILVFFRRDATMLSCDGFSEVLRSICDRR
jgi:hypothetical protein